MKHKFYITLFIFLFIPFISQAFESLTLSTIIISGNERTKDYVIINELGIRTGEKTSEVGSELYFN